MIKILTYNINGIRAVLKKGFLTWLQQTNVDVIGLQEIKATADKIPVKDFEDLGYHCYFHSAKRPGYSGVAILSKQMPIKIIEGIGLSEEYKNYSDFQNGNDDGYYRLFAEGFNVKWRHFFQHPINNKFNEVYIDLKNIENALIDSLDSEVNYV